MNTVRRNFILVLFMAVMFVGLERPAYAQQIRVITTIPDLADITKQIGKELVNVESLTTGVEFMHAVPVKPSFVPKLNRADVLVAIGLDLEISWLPALLEVANNSKIQPGQAGYIDCSNGINIAEVPRTFDRSEGDVHPRGNPHYNLDPLSGRIMARNIADVWANRPQEMGLAGREHVRHRFAWEHSMESLFTSLYPKAFRRAAARADSPSANIVPVLADA